MTVNRLSGNRILIILGEGDLRDYALNIERMDADDSHAMLVLTSLTHAACRREGIAVKNRRLRVEAMPLGKDCYLLVTVSKSRQYSRRPAALCYRFAQAGELTDCLGQLFRAGFVLPRSALYVYENAYYLVLSYPALPRQARGILSEHNAVRCRPLDGAYVGEHGKTLCPHGAVQYIGGFFV